MRSLEQLTGWGREVGMSVSNVESLHRVITRRLKSGIRCLQRPAKRPAETKRCRPVTSERARAAIAILMLAVLLAAPRDSADAHTNPRPLAQRGRSHCCGQAVASQNSHRQWELLISRNRLWKTRLVDGRAIPARRMARPL